MTIRIENHKNVYVLGAGFSSARGLPGIRNFMVRLRDAHPWHVSQSRDKEASAVGAVIRFRQQSTAATYRIPLDLENIEELFSLADAGRDGIATEGTRDLTNNYAARWVIRLGAGDRYFKFPGYLPASTVALRSGWHRAMTTSRRICLFNIPLSEQGPPLLSSDCRMQEAKHGNQIMRCASDTAHAS